MYETPSEVKTQLDFHLMPVRLRNVRSRSLNDLRNRRSCPGEYQLSKGTGAEQYFRAKPRRSGPSVLMWGVEVTQKRRGEATPVVQLRHKPEACGARWLPRKTFHTAAVRAPLACRARSGQAARGAGPS